MRVHPTVDHMLCSGAGPSTPAGYLRPRHVDPAVIGDIADWLGAPPLRQGLRDRLTHSWKCLRGIASRASISG